MAMITVKDATSAPLHERLFEFIERLFLLPFILLWDAAILVAAIWLEVIWLGFIFGSVVGVILLLIFAPIYFIAPLWLLGLLIAPWPETI